MKFILWLQVCPKRGCNSHYIHVLLDGLWHMCLYTNMPYWNFEYTKALSLHCGKSGRWYGSCNWGNPFWVKFTSSFIQCMHAVKIGGWFNPKKVISVAVWIHPGPGGGPPLLQGFNLTKRGGPPPGPGWIQTATEMTFLGLNPPILLQWNRTNSMSDGHWYVIEVTFTLPTALPW